MTKRNVSNARAWILSLNHVSLRSSCLEGARRICVYKREGSMRPGRNGRGQTDARDESRQTDWEKKIRNSCASSVETSLSVPTHTDTPSNVVPELCTLPDQGCSSCEVEWVVCCISDWYLISIYSNEILRSCLLWSTNYITFYQTTVNKKSLYYWSEKYIERKKNCNYYNFIVIYKLFQSIIYIFFVKL